MNPSCEGGLPIFTKQKYVVMPVTDPVQFHLIFTVPYEKNVHNTTSISVTNMLTW